MSFAEMKKSGPPNKNEIEVCVFGPNYGECIIIHLGNCNWIVIDSCLYLKEAVALSYLQAMGIDSGSAIRAVIATHWHDDHYRGLSQIIERARDAEVWISSVLTDLEFLRFVSRTNKNSALVAGHKLNEFLAVFENIRERRLAGRVNFGFSSARTSVFKLDSSESGHGYSCEVVAISPSHGDKIEFLERIVANMPQPGQTKRAATTPTPNHASVAALVSIGPIGILLGADVENSTKPSSGWEGILAAQRLRPFGSPASLHKAAHHGSENAHNEGVWQSLLGANPLTVLTPWRNGGRRLPTAEGIKKILRLSPSSFITAAEARSKSEKNQRPPAVLRSLRENRGIRLRSLVVPFGAVRFRLTDFSRATWQVECFGAARDLRGILSEPTTR